jgi:hypothetical protein
MESLAHNVKDMAPETRHGIEAVLGETLQDDQVVYLVVITPDAEPSDEKRAAAIADLHEICKQGTAHRESLGISVEEADEALEEAMEYMRFRTGGP